MYEQDENSPDNPPEQPAKEQSSPTGVAPRLDLLVDEHEEEVSVDGRTVRGSRTDPAPTFTPIPSWQAGPISASSSRPGRARR